MSVPKEILEDVVDLLYLSTAQTIPADVVRELLYDFSEVIDGEPDTIREAFQERIHNRYAEAARNAGKCHIDAGYTTFWAQREGWWGAIVRALH